MSIVSSVWLSASDYPPPKGKNVLLENPSGVPIIGIWQEGYLYWMPLPQRK